MENTLSKEKVIEEGEKFGFKLDSPHPTEKEIEENSYFLIRHATSAFNFKAAAISQEFGSDSAEFRANQVDPNGFDPELHEFGTL